MRSSRSRRSSSLRSRSSFSRRSPSFSTFSRSRSRYGTIRGFNRSIPITRLHPLSRFLLTLLMLSFFFNFVMIIVAPFALFDWGLWIFFLPFIFAILFIIVTVLTSLTSLQQGVVASVHQQFIDSGRVLTPLNLNSSIAHYFEWKEQDERWILLTLPKKTKYDARLLQTLLEPLKQQSYREVWIVQDPSSFVDTDRDYARFYNVVLLNLLQLQEKLSPVNASTAS